VNLPERTVLVNGGVLVSQALPSNPFVAFRGSVPAGVAAEDGDAGLAEFLARLLLSGTRRRSAAKIADRLEGMGAALEFRAGEEALIFQGRCTREAIRETFRILVECLSEPAFPPAEVERVRTELLNEYRIEQDDTRYRASRALAEAVFPKGHPYGREPKGDPSAIRRRRRSDIVAFHEAHVGPEGLVLAVAGDVDPALIEEVLAKPLSRLSGGGQAASTIPSPPPYRPRSVRIPMPHKAQVDVAIGGPAVSRKDEAFYALHLANLLFGRIGLFGRLGKRVRDDLGLAYYAYSSLDARSAGGLWSISAGVNPANLSKAVAAIREEMDRLRTEPFTEDEIEDGKENQIGSLTVSLERNAEVAAELHRMEYYGLGMDFLERYPDIIRNLSAEEVRRAATRFFDPERASLAIAGPLGRTEVRL